MPSKKKKYNARFPAGRIKKIMQTDEEVGKVAQAVPVIISRTLELFVESLLTKALEITSAKNAKTLSPSHMKQCILSESRFDFLKELVANLPDVANSDAEEGIAPPVTSPARGNAPGAASPKPRRHSEGTSRAPAPPMTVLSDDSRAISLQSVPTNSVRMHANFYKENEEVHEGAQPPENRLLNNAMQNMTPFTNMKSKVEIDEDYDTS